ncbi:MAG: TIGR00730 family Rossman fold protein [Terriglobales bacterium]|jgi:uncharacterized protein (TIGR00730 family)
MDDKSEPGSSTSTRAPLAYENTAFLNSRDARSLRILSEYLEPLARFRRQQVQDTVVFFGSARFHSRSAAQSALEFLEKPGSRQPASPEWQAQIRRANADLQMARYFEDARRLAFLLTQWSLAIPSRRRFVVTTGGGPGIMEAANLGASEAGGKTIGLNIRLPYEQMPNRYITPELNFEFHYFFMRKLWFAYLAKALVVFPGGFGTLDEMFEILTLVQTEKLSKPIGVAVYGREFWTKVVNFEALAEMGAISPQDLDLFTFVDSPEEAFEFLKGHLTRHYLVPGPAGRPGRVPELAKTRP